MMARAARLPLALLLCSLCVKAGVIDYLAGVPGHDWIVEGLKGAAPGPLLPSCP